MSDLKKPLPELLCPAGSPEAFDAAIEGGADAIYLGSTAFNARMYAKNFGGDDLRSAVLRAHAFGIKVYLTLNTLVTDRELTDFLRAAEQAGDAGVDALIVADLGGAAAIRRTFPTLELHASTQMSGHSADMGKELQRLGYSRMVIARETSMEDARTVIRRSPIEVELFVHGALCVSHSGQCLFSSVVGGRSGNRGACAQPCRLPFACSDCKGKSEKSREGYPLSLKDLSLAAHVPALIDMGVASLKIEGRMKSPEYVRDTARIWRRLLDERRAATPDEMRLLAEIFSRGGLTDAYFTKTVSRKMLGVRSADDKSSTRALEPFTGLTRKYPLSLSATLRADAPVTVTLSDGSRSVTVAGEVPQAAVNAPLSRETVARNLTKFGATVYAVTDIDIALDDGIMLPISKLNDLRRRAVAAWEEGFSASAPLQKNGPATVHPSGVREKKCTARFYKPSQITPEARSYFDELYLPLQAYAPIADGVVLPPVIFDSDRDRVKEMLLDARAQGAKRALVGNLGHLALVREAGLVPVGDYRLNLTNSESVVRMEGLGVEEMLLSPELTLPQIRDMGGNTAAIVYGRLPLMTLEKCVIREIADCEACATDRVLLRDRRGVSFPVLREWEHRNVICNSLPTAMCDREDELVRAGVTNRHFLFTVESPAEVDRVINAYRRHASLGISVRRI